MSENQISNNNNKPEKKPEKTLEHYSLKLYWKIVTLARGALKIIHPPKVDGLENIPQEGPFILCANHLSLRDPVLIATICKRPLRFMAKQELFETKAKWFSRFLYGIGAFPVARGEGDLSAIRTSLSVLKDGQCLGIFPQGTRRKKRDAQEPPMNAGVAMIAVRAKVPVIPVYLKAPYRLFRRMHVVVGKPLDFTSIRRADMETLSNVTQQISGAIFSLNAPDEQ